MDKVEFLKALRTCPPNSLIEALVEIYANSHCDESGRFNPEDSLAGSGGADFIDSVNWVMVNLIPSDK